MQSGDILRSLSVGTHPLGDDDFTAFEAGTDLGGNTEDLDALEAWFAGGAPVTPPPAGRITRLDSPPG